MKATRMVLWILLLVSLDQALKIWAVSTFQEEAFQPYLEGVLSLGLIYNTGAAWGLLGSLTLPLALLRLGVGVAVTVQLSRGRWAKHQVPLTLVASGALGNAIDGLRLQKVVDPLMFHPLSSLTQWLYGQDFPIFNLADVFVVSGVVLIVIQSLAPSSPPVTKQGV